MKRNTARKQAQRAIPTGESCQRCGEKTKRLERHHADYEKPLDVEILCPVCHAKADQEIGLRRKRQPKACKICQTMFWPNHSKNHTTCSASCLSFLGKQNAEKRWKGHSQKKSCLNCGTEFTPPRSRAVTCSASCGNKLAWKKRKATLGPTASGQISQE